LRLRAVVVKRITVTEFGVNDGGDSGRGCFGNDVTVYTAELTIMIIHCVHEKNGPISMFKNLQN